MSDPVEIPAFSERGDVHVIVETIRGSRARFKYDSHTKAFLFSRSLRLGLAYPYDWGFIPMAEDGDPLDGLVLNEFVTFPGALIRCRCSRSGSARRGASSATIACGSSRPPLQRNTAATMRC